VAVIRRWAILGSNQ